MLKKILNKFVMTPVLVAGVFISPSVSAKPNITALTSDKSAQEVSSETNKPMNFSRIPEDVNKHYFGLGIGQTFLFGDFEKNGINKITPDFFYNYTASYSFDFMANLHYSKFEYKQNSVQLPGLALSIKAKGFQFDAFSPFALGGLGFYLPTAKYMTDDGMFKTHSRLVFGFNFGGGAELRLNDRVIVGAMAQFHHPFKVRQEDAPDLGGSYMKLLITGMFSFE